MLRAHRGFLLIASTLLVFSACGPSPTVISGTLLGADGEQMIAAGVRVTQWNARYRADSINPTAVFQDVTNGEFEIETFETGILAVRFLGAYHEEYLIPVYVDTAVSIAVDVRLGTEKHPEEYESVTLRADISESEDRTEVEMTKQEDGSYTAEIETADSILTYTLFARGEDDYFFTHGTDSDEFIVDRSYASIARPVDGVATVVFDPKKLPLVEQEVEATFADPNSLQAQFIALRELADERMERYRDAWRESDDDDFEYDWSADVAELEEAVESEQEDILKQALLFELLAIRGYSEDVDTSWLSRGLDEIHATSPIWSLDAGVMVRTVKRIELPDTSLSDTVRAHTWLAALDSVEYHNAVRPAAHFYNALNRHTDPEVQAELLSSALASASRAGDTTKAVDYYNRLASEHPNYEMLEFISSLYSPYRNIAVGKMIPDYSVVSLEDSTVFLTRDEFLGSVYLIDFWATWCGPCIGELPNLNEAYDKYKDSGFQVLSIAVDDEKEEIAKFREEEWEMPWLHAFHGWDDEAIEAFEVQGIPRAILVDAEGKILAADYATRGERLFETLERILGGGN